MPTIKEIARECGVSVATASNIINDKGKVGEPLAIFAVIVALPAFFAVIFP